MKKLLLLLCIAFTTLVKTKDIPTTYRAYDKAGGRGYLMNVFCSKDQVVAYLEQRAAHYGQMITYYKQAREKHKFIRDCIVSGILYGCLGILCFIALFPKKAREFFKNKDNQNNVNKLENEKQTTENPSSNFSIVCPCTAMYGNLQQCPFLCLCNCYPPYPSCPYHPSISHTLTSTAQTQDVPTTYRAYAETKEGALALERAFGSN